MYRKYDYYYLLGGYMASKQQEMDRLFGKLAKQGVLSSYEVRGYAEALKSLLAAKLVQPNRKRKKVFYELTDKALPQLENHRLELMAKLKKLSSFSPRSKVYQALLEDVRFLDESKPEAKDFMLLGRWNLTRPVVSSQLLLARYRYFASQGLE